jgi:AAA family ATP:ADP antiporter
VVTLHRGERAVALLMFTYSFLAMAAWNILRPLTRSKFISDLGADNVPYVMLAAGVLIGLLMHQYTRAIRRLPRARVIPVTQTSIVAVLVAFWALLRTDAVWVTVGFYFLGLFLGLLLISQFWTLANDIYDARQAKRLFGFIGGGASLGGAAGSGVTLALVRRLGTDNMILVGALILAACVVVVLAILSRHRLTGTADLGQEEEGVGAREAWRLIRESRHLKIMALVIGFAAAGAQIIDQQLNMAAEVSRGDQGEAALAEFFAQIGIYLSLAGFVVQISLTRWIHRSFGLAVALLLLPVALGATATIILISGAIWATAVARVIDTTLRYTVDKTTREVLFLPLSPELKYRAKPFIDVTADRFAKAVAALLLLVLIKPWGLGLDWRTLSYASLAMLGLWIATALVARREYLRSFRASIGAQAIAPEAIRTDVADAATIETLVEELSNPDPVAVLYAIGMLESFDKRHLVSPLLLQHDAPEVRARVLRSLSAVRSRIAVRWKPAVERLIHDPDVDVRAAALRALAALSREDAAAVMRRHLLDPEPRVAVTACVGLAGSPHHEDVDAAQTTLERLIGDTREAGGPGRREAAVALAHIRLPRFRPLLVPLLYDHDIQVVEQAIKSARTLGAEDGLFLPGLISLLGHRVLKAAARDALIGYGEPVVGALAHAMADEREDPWIRRHIPATLASIPAQSSMDALVASLDDTDGFLRYKSIAAIEKLRRNHPSFTFPPAAIERLVLQEASRYYGHLLLRHDFLRSANEQGSLLARALDEKLERTLDRLYRLLGLLYQADDVAAARYTIEHGDPRRRAAAVEYLDTLLKGAVRRRVLPILDVTPPSEKLRQAYLALKTRPRDLEDTLAQLVHEDDPVLAAAAVHFIASRRMWTLADDLQYLLTHRSPDDRAAIEAASWALGLRHRSGREPAHEPYPIVELAHRVRMLPLFEFVSVDELFRIASLGGEARLSAGRELHQPAAMPRHVDFLIEGTVEVIEPAEGPREVTAPAVVGLEEVLQGAPLPGVVRAVEPIVSFQIQASDFLTMVSDNVLLAQSLFRMLMADAARVGASFPELSSAADLTPQTPLQPIDRALMLRDHPLLARATPAQLLALTAAAREVPLARGEVLFDADAPPALYQVIDGEIALHSPAAGRRLAGPGTTFGIAETLAGAGSGWQATVSRSGRALRLERDDLFAVLTDHVDLMQGVFSEVLALRKIPGHLTDAPGIDPAPDLPERLDGVPWVAPGTRV